MSKGGCNFKTILLIGIILCSMLVSSCQEKVEGIKSNQTEPSITTQIQSMPSMLSPSKSATITNVPSDTPAPTSTSTPSSTPAPTMALTPSPTPIGGGTGWIFFTGCQNDAVCGLYRIHMDDKNLQTILPPKDQICCFKITPDRTKIAYATGPFKNSEGTQPLWDLYILDLNTMNSIKIAEIVNLTNLIWSPDSSKIAVITYDEIDQSNIEWNNIYVINSDGSNNIRVNGDVTAWNFWLLWTSDSQHILFSGGTPFRLIKIQGSHKITEPVDGSSDPYWASLYLVKSDGSELKRVSPERKARDFWSAVWFDDENQVIANTNLCSFAGCSQNYLRIVDLQTGDLIQTDPKEINKDNFAISPDLNHFVSWCTYFICSVSFESIDGSKKETLGRGIYWDALNYPNDLQTWSPDGNFFALIAYSDFNDWQHSTSALYIDNIQDKKPSFRVTKWLYRYPSDIYDWHWSWSPDSRFIVYATPGKGTLYLLDLSDLDNPTPEAIYENSELNNIGPIYWQP